MEILLLLIIIATFSTVIIARTSKTTPPRVILVTGATVTFISIVAYFAALYSETSDVLVMNGEVVDKYRDDVSCTHSYDCNCRTKQDCSGSGDKRSCTTRTVCDTCYEHTRDYDWVVKANIGSTTISRIDRQGKHEPPRFSAVQVGEPFSKTTMYINYVKAAEFSIFNNKNTELDSRFSKLIPAYPTRIYDYYKIDRALSAGVSVPDLVEWSRSISTMLKKLGPLKQANIIVLFVNTNDRNYEYALKKAWGNGKKNDIIVILGTTSYPKIDWAGVLTWSDKELFKIKLRDELEELSIIDKERVLEIISKNTIEHFKRKEMADFEYLKYELSPPVWALVSIFLFMTISIFSTPFVFAFCKNRRIF